MEIGESQNMGAFSGDTGGLLVGKMLLSRTQGDATQRSSILFQGPLCKIL